MIHAHAAPERNINSVADVDKNAVIGSVNAGSYFERSGCEKIHHNFCGYGGFFML